MDEETRIGIEYVNHDDDTKWLVEFGNNHKFFKDWSSMIAYLIQIRSAKGFK